MSEPTCTSPVICGTPKPGQTVCGAPMDHWLHASYKLPICESDPQFCRHHAFVSEPLLVHSKAVRSAALAVADIDAKLAQRLHTASQDIFELSTPDIKLPEQPEGGVFQPQSAVVEVAGVGLQLVNWQDYRGWEVRRRCSYASETGLPLGYIWNVDSNIGQVSYRATRPVPAQTGTAGRVDAALLALLKAANLA